MNKSLDEFIEVSLTTGSWTYVDATMDNVISDSAMEGNTTAVRMGEEIRQAGWDQVADVDGQWPSPQKVITIQLRRSHWLFAIDHLRQSQAAYESFGDRQSLDIVHATLDEVSPQIT